MTQPFFSIITITKNNLNGLKATQKSIQSQTCDDYEWIIIDGASTDQTSQHLKTLTSPWISEPDTGIYDAMNKGIKKAKGNYIIFMNAADAFAFSNILQSIKTKSSQNKPAFIYGDALEKNTIKHARPAKIKNGMFTHHQAMLYNREALTNLTFNESYKIAGDYDFTARFLKTIPQNTILYIPIPICIFEVGGLSQTNPALGRTEQFKIRKTLKLCSPLENHIITTTQHAAMYLRTHCPRLYRALRSAATIIR